MKLYALQIIKSHPMLRISVSRTFLIERRFDSKKVYVFFFFFCWFFGSQRIEAFGGPNEVGEAVIRTITRASKRPDLKGTLIQTTLREDSTRNVKYYELEFKVESSSFRRHNVAVCFVYRGKLYTLNAQAPESEWPGLKSEMRTIANSFCLSA